MYREPAAMFHSVDDRTTSFRFFALPVALLLASSSLGPAAAIAVPADATTAPAAPAISAGSAAPAGPVAPADSAAPAGPAAPASPAASSSQPESPADSKSQARIAVTLEQVYRYLRGFPPREMPWHLGFILIAASNGKELFEMKEHESDECRRSVLATAKMRRNYYYHREFRSMYAAAVRKAAEVIGAATEYRHPLEVYCDEIGRQVERSAGVRERFERYRAGAKLHGEGGRGQAYLSGLPTNDPTYQRTIEAFFVQIVLFIKFEDQTDATKAYNEYCYVLAKAIERVAQKEAYRGQVEETLEAVMSEMTEVVRTIGVTTEDVETNEHVSTPSMMSKFEEHFGRDPNLKRELEEAKKQVKATGRVGRSAN